MLSMLASTVGSVGRLDKVPVDPICTGRSHKMYSTVGGGDAGALREATCISVAKGRVPRHELRERL